MTDDPADTTMGQVPADSAAVQQDAGVTADSTGVTVTDSTAAGAYDSTTAAPAAPVDTTSAAPTDTTAAPKQ